MDNINSVPAGNVRGFECFGPNGSVVFCTAQGEALFWHSLGYVVLHVCHSGL
ncbi:hypothetical protein [Variovorax sp. PBL-E5]|uniref:hypothetical protein n=1 Tax=Variovorax sp. PBL-E5 TaxID=434014 RepID=UPI001319B16B|nr:hypothetical protein [Variovorax sp. PBL-E5]VTU40204.1 hypothetical protein E5CHR_05399 [Variovorax sp. PBL-E5]